MKHAWLFYSFLCALPSTAQTIFEYESTQDLLKPLNLSHIFAQKQAYKLERGSLTIRLKNHISEGKKTFLGISDPNSQKYINFYVNRTAAGADIFGIEIRNQKNVSENRHLVAINQPTESHFTTLTYLFDDKKKQIRIYVNGIQKHVDRHDIFLADIVGLSQVYLGKTEHKKLPSWQFLGEVYYAELNGKVLTPQEIQKKHQTLSLKHQQALNQDQLIKREKGAYQREKQTLFKEGQDGAKSYRIPSLLTTKAGTLIAAIDKRNQHASDWGNIDTVIRRSFNGGLTWENAQIVLDLPSQPYGSQNSAFLIDPLLVQNRKTERIFMLVDMFPEAKGFFDLKKTQSQGSGYQKLRGKFYRELSDNEGNRYTVRDNGVVYDNTNTQTDYRVIVSGAAEKAFKDIGDLYLGSQRLGNIFLNSRKAKHDSAPLSAKVTSYLWLTYSDDEGKSWSSPTDITPQIKADWMLFLGTGPGIGIQSKNGNLIVPIYYTNLQNRQSSAVIISKDNGKTWIRGESPNDSLLKTQGGSEMLNSSDNELTESQIIELDNGVLKMFSRNLAGKVRISTSLNGGMSWLADKTFDETLLDPNSQLSVIKYSKRINGKEYVIFANPHSPTRSRMNGKVWLGEVQPDNTILWKYTTTINAGSYAYNSLTELPNGDIGLLYEESPSKIQYVSFNLQELLWREK